jgi:hypothetical protein
MAMTDVEADLRPPQRAGAKERGNGTASPPADPAKKTSSGGKQPPRPELDVDGRQPVRGPVTVAWREGTLTRAKELETLCAWLHPRVSVDDRALENAIAVHIAAAREAAERARPDPSRRWRFFRSASLLERAKSNLDAAEAQLLNLAPPEYVLGQMPSLLTQVQCHLIASDPRRLAFERIARKVGVKDADHPLIDGEKEQDVKRRLAIINENRGQIVTAVRGASSAALREKLRVRSFRNVVAVATGLMATLAIGLAIMGYTKPTLIPLCFAPQDGDETIVVCPTAQSEAFPTDPAVSNPPGTPQPDIDDKIDETASSLDIVVVELVGLTAAAVAAAATIRSIRGSSERLGVPIALVLLKLPTGALTAFLGLLLMRGQFVPGLSALDTSAQILAWALVFGYAQQLFTRLVDRQGQTVLDSVRGADKTEQVATPP